MNTVCRATCTYIQTLGESRAIWFSGVYSDDPNHPNRLWSKYTPVFNLNMVIDNPEVEIKMSKEYEITFKEV